MAVDPLALARDYAAVTRSLRTHSGTQQDFSVRLRRAAKPLRDLRHPKSDVFLRQLVELALLREGVHPESPLGIYSIAQIFSRFPSSLTFTIDEPIVDDGSGVYVVDVYEVGVYL